MGTVLLSWTSSFIVISPSRLTNPWAFISFQRGVPIVV